MTEARLTDDSPQAWFAEFRRQSFDPDALGSLRWHKELTGGLSEARVILCLCATDSDTKSQPLVLKWGPLDQILKGAMARRDLAKERGLRQQDQLRILEARGASHVAIRRAPGDGRFYGILASPYAMSLNPRNGNRISDYEEFIQDVYVDRQSVTDEGLFDRLSDTIQVLAPKMAQPPGEHYLVDVPGISGIERKYAIALRVLSARGTLPPWMPPLGTWIIDRLGTVLAYNDVRAIHGDPRFANVVLDRQSNEITLIDYEEGESGHVFSDLARFEVEVVFRTTRPGRPRIEEIRSRARILYGLAEAMPSDPPALRVGGIWRTVRDQHIAELAQADTFTQYSTFILYELLRRVSYHEKGRSLDDVGGSLEEIVTTLRVVADATVARALSVTQWRNTSVKDLNSLLALAGVDISAWGAGQSKTVAHLLSELRNGDCQLIVDGDGLARQVRNVWVDVYCTVGDARRHLVEREQVFDDGRSRARDLPASLGEKCIGDEEPTDAAQRALSEELGIASPLTIAPAPARENPLGTASYPGLRTVYDSHWFTAELDPADYRAEGYIEEQRDKRTTFEWED